MQPLAILLVLLSAAMHAFRNFFNKKALDKQAFVWWYEVFGLIFFTPLFLFTLLHDVTNSHISTTFICLSGFVHFIYWYFLTKALDKGDLSLIYPIMRSSPALVLIFSITILGEDVSVLGVSGILLVAIGVYTINMQSLAFFRAVPAVSIYDPGSRHPVCLFDAIFGSGLYAGGQNRRRSNAPGCLRLYLSLDRSRFV